MPTIIFQGLQSCCESQRSLNLTSFNHHFSKYQELSQKTSIPGATMSGWECIKAISTGGSSCRWPETEDNDVYVHPLIKSASSMLSEKSLEMCTENLGSETGSDTAGSGIFPSGEVTSLDDLERPPTKESRKSGQKSEIKKFNRRDLPPPLTTLRVSNPIRLGPHRESGRLVIEAIASIHTRHYDIHAERRDGRLRLSFLTDYSSDFDPQYAVRENKVEENGKCGDDAVFEDAVDDCEIEENGECGEELSEEKEEEDEENVAEEDEEQHEGDDSLSRKDIDGNNLKVGIKVGISEFQRPSICKEGGHGNKIINWKLFCVATS